MSIPFLITGLPRSRTAWWSVATTTPISVCHHEPLKNCQSFEDLAALWAVKEPAYVGVSDSGIAPQLGRILAEVQPRTVIVERPVEHVERSFAAYFVGAPYDRAALHAYLQDSAAHLAKHRDHPLVKVVAFDALNNLGTVEDCIDWLMPNDRPAFRRELMHMNIQVELTYTLEQIARPHNRWFER